MNQLKPQPTVVSVVDQLPTVAADASGKHPACVVDIWRRSSGTL